MSARKPAVTKSATKKSAATKAAPSHPTWADMIKECIAINTEDARIGVSRPQIKKYVETKYKLEIGAAQSTQLAKAITAGAEKGVFVLPKGPSGRVKLAPKSKPADTSSKENKPTPNKPASKLKSAVTTKAKPKAPPAPKIVAKTTPKTTTAKKAVKSKVAPKKPAAAKKVLAGKPKPKSPAKKMTVASKRAPAKKAVTGTTSASKARTAAAKKASAKKALKKEVVKPVPKARKSPTKRSS